MLVDESATGVHVRTPSPGAWGTGAQAQAQATPQFARGQLLMIKPSGTQAALAKLRWAVEYREDAADGVPFLDIGLELVPLKPVAVMLKLVEAPPQGMSAATTPAGHIIAFELKLLGTAHGHYAAWANTLWLPKGWFQKNRALDISWAGRESSISGASTRAVLTELIEEGPNYEVVRWA
jgi:hypothetical protein